MSKKKNMDVVENREWVISQYVDQGIPTSDHLKLRKQPLNTAVLVRINYISVSYSDQVLTAFGAGEVIGSKSTDYNSVGDVVLYYLMPVAEYAILPAGQFLHMFDPATIGISVPDYLTALGWILGRDRGQLAKLRGFRVVGSVGSDAKVKLLKEEIGYDEAFNYNVETDFDAALTKYFPNGIDIYLDNVGGKMLEAVLNHVNRHARIPLCGMISQYNKMWSEQDGVRNLLNMVGKDVRMEGFMMSSYVKRNGEFMAEMLSYIKQDVSRDRHILRDHAVPLH